MSFDQLLMEHELIIRLTFFFGIFVVIARWELITPRRTLNVSKVLRWSNNILLVALNSIILRLLFPAAAVGVAAYSQTNGWGLLNYYQLPYLASLILAIIAMDFVIYLQHVLVHAVPALWRLHRVHHADPDYDVTTGARFHPIEIILSMLIKFATIVVLGAPVAAVIVFEVILNGMAMFNHGNIKLPEHLDGVLRRFIVTPDMHRVHHSVEDNEANSNFGFNLSIWDRAFGTYIAQPRKGHEEMDIGIHKYHEPKLVATLPGMLILPFIGKVSGYAINRREWSNDEPPEKNANTIQKPHKE